MNAPTPKQVKRNRTIAAVLVGVIVVVIVAVATHKSPADQRFDVDAACQHFVKIQLKAPSTASFGSVDSATFTGSADTWTESSTVDSENGFGAKLRSDFACAVHKTSDGWVLDSITGLS